MKHISYLVFCSLLFIVSCTDDSDLPDNTTSNCDQNLIINDDTWNTASDDFHNITNATLEDDCLSITFAASGCDASSWEYDLVASTASPSLSGYLIRLSFENEEACLAYFTKTVSFDISGLQDNNANQMNIQLQGWEETIVYNY